MQLIGLSTYLSGLYANFCSACVNFAFRHSIWVHEGLNLSRPCNWSFWQPTTTFYCAIVHKCFHICFLLPIFI